MGSKTVFVMCLALLTASALLAHGGAPAERTAPHIQLLETGEFHGDEVSAETGEEWLGLFPTPAGFALLPAVIAVDRVHDPVVDEEDSGKKSGKKVSVGGGVEPVFLLKGADMLRPGSAVTVWRGDKSLGNGAVVSLRLGANKYQLKVVSGTPEPADHLTPGAKLLLTSGRRTQVLISLEEINDATWALHWAGDIDGDGKLDLYMDLSNHYNASRRKLFLSSQAGGGGLVKEVATFTTVGC